MGDDEPAATANNTQRPFSAAMSMSQSRPMTQGGMTMYSNLTGKNQSQKNINNINKSIAKLEQIHDANWSLKD